MTDIRDAILPLILEETGEEEIDPSQPLLSSGWMDSFAIVSLLTLINEELGIEIDPEDLTLDNFDTLDRMVAFIESQRQAAQAG